MARTATHSPSRFVLCLASLLGVFAFASQTPPALAQTPYDTVAVAPTAVARVGIAMNITAGPSGAPGGFSVCWMTLADFLANGSDWYYADSVGADLDGSFTGAPTKHTGGGTITSYVLAPYQTVTVEIGDLFDETGVTTTDTDELVPGVTYVMCAFANGSGGQLRSAYSATYVRTTDPATDCIHSQGYWKNHPLEWPLSSLTLGTVTYTKAQLLSILNKPAQGNGLIFLAHQLIATKLNIANGGITAPIAATVAASDALIGSLVVPPVGAGYLTPSSASGYTNTMDDYNNGELGGPILCPGTPARNATWGQVKTLYR